MHETLPRLELAAVQPSDLHNPLPPNSPEEAEQTGQPATPVKKPNDVTIGEPHEGSDQRESLKTETPLDRDWPPSPDTIYDDRVEEPMSESKYDMSLRNRRLERQLLRYQEQKQLIRWNYCRRREALLQQQLETCNKLYRVGETYLAAKERRSPWALCLSVVEDSFLYHVGSWDGAGQRLIGVRHELELHVQYMVHNRKLAGLNTTYAQLLWENRDCLSGIESINSPMALLCDHTGLELMPEPKSENGGSRRWSWWVDEATGLDPYYDAANDESQEESDWSLWPTWTANKLTEEDRWTAGEADGYYADDKWTAGDEQ